MPWIIKLRLVLDCLASEHANPSCWDGMHSPSLTACRLVQCAATCIPVSLTAATSTRSKGKLQWLRNLGLLDEEDSAIAGQMPPFESTFTQLRPTFSWDTSCRPWRLHESRPPEGITTSALLGCPRSRHLNAAQLSTLRRGVVRFSLYMRQTLHHRHSYVAGTSSHLLCSTWQDLLHTPSFDTRAPTVLLPVPLGLKG